MANLSSARLVAAVFAVALWISTSADASSNARSGHTLKTENTISILTRAYDLPQEGPGALCIQWYPCGQRLKCILFKGKRGRYGLGVCKRVIRAGYRCNQPHSVCIGH
eukprot:IDg2478t1